jgi:RHH-type transcriptional regulator, rel operon repressor / antitoxin RelB
MRQSTLVTVRVKPEIAIRLQQLAKSIDRSKSYLAAEAIEEYLDIHEWQIQAIQEGLAAADCEEETISFDEIKKYWKQQDEDSANQTGR